jgi:hypothetical protein
MRAMVLSAPGTPLQMQKRRDTGPGYGEIRVKVSACNTMEFRNAACFSAGEIDELAEASHNVRRLKGQIAQDSNAAIPEIRT